MAHMTIEAPEGALVSLNQDPQGPGLRPGDDLAAAAKWYELKLVSQGRAAEIAGVSRAEFLVALPPARPSRPRALQNRRSVRIIRI